MRSSISFEVETCKANRSMSRSRSNHCRKPCSGIYYPIVFSLLQCQFLFIDNLCYNIRLTLYQFVAFGVYICGLENGCSRQLVKLVRAPCLQETRRLIQCFVVASTKSWGYVLSPLTHADNTSIRAAIYKVSREDKQKRLYYCMPLSKDLAELVGNIMLHQSRRIIVLITQLSICI